MTTAIYTRVFTQEIGEIKILSMIFIKQKVQQYADLGCIVEQNVKHKRKKHTKGLHIR